MTLVVKHARLPKRGADSASTILNLYIVAEAVTEPAVLGAQSSGPLFRITSVYQRALAFGMRCPVA